MTTIESYFHNAKLSIELATQLNTSANYREAFPIWTVSRKRIRKMRLNAIRSLQYALEMESVGNWLSRRA
jgi:hypothetical protein